MESPQPVAMNTSNGTIIKEAVSPKQKLETFCRSFSDASFASLNEIDSDGDANEMGQKHRKFSDASFASLKAIDSDDDVNGMEQKQDQGGIDQRLQDQLKDLETENEALKKKIAELEVTGLVEDIHENIFIENAVLKNTIEVQKVAREEEHHQMATSQASARLETNKIKEQMRCLMGEVVSKSASLKEITELSERDRSLLKFDWRALAGMLLMTCVATLLVVSARDDNVLKPKQIRYDLLSGGVLRPGEVLIPKKTRWNFWHPFSMLVVQGDGNAVLLNGERAITWSTQTTARPMRNFSHGVLEYNTVHEMHLSRYGILSVVDMTRSRDVWSSKNKKGPRGMYEANINSKGDLVIEFDGKEIWSSATITPSTWLQRMIQK